MSISSAFLCFPGIHLRFLTNRANQLLLEAVEKQAVTGGVLR